jgi:hypothetical protein
MRCMNVIVIPLQTLSIATQKRIMISSLKEGENLGTDLE